MARLAATRRHEPASAETERSKLRCQEIGPEAKRCGRLNTCTTEASMPRLLFLGGTPSWPQAKRPRWRRSAPVLPGRLAALEELNRSLMLLRGATRLERAEPCALPLLVEPHLVLAVRSSATSIGACVAEDTSASRRSADG